MSGSISLRELKAEYAAEKAHHDLTRQSLRMAEKSLDNYNKEDGSGLVQKLQEKVAEQNDRIGNLELRLSQVNQHRTNAYARSKNLRAAIESSFELDPPYGYRALKDALAEDDAAQGKA